MTNQSNEIQTAVTDKNQDTISRTQLTNFVNRIVESLVEINNSFMQSLITVGDKTTKVETSAVAALQVSLESLSNALLEVVGQEPLNAVDQDVHVENQEETDD